MKKIYFLIIIIILILLVVILFLFNNKYLNDSLDGTDTELRDFVIEERNKTKGKVQEISSISDYELVRVCIQKFYTYYFQIYDENIICSENDSEFDLEYYKEKLYNFFSEEYISEKEITIENIDRKLDKNEFDLVEIYNVYYATNYENMNVYFVKGLLRNSETFNSKDFEITLYLDTNKQCFKVNMNNILNEDYSSLEVGTEVNFVIPEYIADDKINRYTYPSVSYDEYGKMIFDNIRKLLLYNPEKAFNMMTSIGKEKFQNFDYLNEYVNKNRKNIFMLTYKTYEISFKDDIFTMILYDSNSQYMINVYLNSFSNIQFEIEKL